MVTEKRRDVGGITNDNRHEILKELHSGMGKFNTRFYWRFSTV